MQSQWAVSWIELTAALMFGLAVLHTFSVKYFEHLARTNAAHSGLWHLLGEVETVFGIWAFALLAFIAVAQGWGAATDYLDTRRFVEPQFVFVILVICGSRPILQLVSGAVNWTGRALPVPPGFARYFLSLSVVPLLGSFITEPAAMTLAALMLRDTVFSRGISSRLKYATIGVLFVNISIGGTLTNFAAPPILMVASTWGWDSVYVFTTFGWKAALAVFINATVLSFAFRRQLIEKATVRLTTSRSRVPMSFIAVNLAILAAVVAFSHHPEMFMGFFLLFLGLAEAYKKHHDRLMLREGLMVAFFLAGLVVLGGQQKWWLQEALSSLDSSTLFYGAAALTAITDNAALTYLGALVEGVSSEFKYSLVAGAVAGGGLTVIANAPNPAGFAILKDSFDEKAINPLGLFIAALPPTLTALVLLGSHVNRAIEILDPASWMEWLQSLDNAFLFLLILPFAVAAIGLWTELLTRNRNR